MIYILIIQKDNCNQFGISRFKNSQRNPIASICSGIQGFFTSHGITNNELVLTHDINKDRNGDRRDEACPKVFNTTNKKLGGYCINQVNQLRNSTKDNSIKLSCDEFPFANSKEGGAYFDNLPNTQGGISSTYVPIHQQNLQGNYNSTYQKQKLTLSLMLIIPNRNSKRFDDKR